MRRSASPFNCNECDEVYYKKFDFYEHWNIHSKQTPFMCNTCFECFTLIKDYANHYKSEHLKSTNPMVSELDKNLEESTNESDSLKPRDFSKTKCQSRRNSKDSSDQKLVNGAERADSVIIKNNLGKLLLFDEHKCEECSKFFSTTEDFLNHLKDHAQNSEYSSDEDISDDDGNKSTPKTNGHKMHKYYCDCCDIKFLSLRSLRKHICYIKPIFGENFKCSCSKEFTTSSDFKAHIGKKPYSCCLCSMKFVQFAHFIRHIRTHTNQKPYICDLCGKQFSQSSNLRTHSTIHSNYNSFKCSECSYTSNSIGAIRKHRIKHKNGFYNSSNFVDGKMIRIIPKRIPCPSCKKKFTSEKIMKMHLKTHDFSSTLCIECGKVFESKHKLDSHFKACHEKPSECSFCGKVFASAILLHSHKKIHKKSKTLFSCDICGKSFAIRNYLAQHLKTHSKEKKYFCANCGKQFKVNASLKYHRKICNKKSE